MRNIPPNARLSRPQAQLQQLRSSRQALVVALFPVVLAACAPDAWRPDDPFEAFLDQIQNKCGEMRIGSRSIGSRWAPFVMGAAGLRWFEPLHDIVNWDRSGLEIRNCYKGERLASRPQNLDHYFRLGIAFATIGSNFGARAHVVRSIFSDVGASCFPDDVPSILCQLNTTYASKVLSSLNPGMHFTLGDVARLPLREVPDAVRVYEVMRNAFDYGERVREPSRWFRTPGPSPWVSAQAWAFGSFGSDHSSASSATGARRHGPCDVVGRQSFMVLSRLEPV